MTYQSILKVLEDDAFGKKRFGEGYPEDVKKEKILHQKYRKRDYNRAINYEKFCATTQFAHPDCNEWEEGNKSVRQNKMSFRKIKKEFKKVGA